MREVNICLQRVHFRTYLLFTPLWESSPEKWEEVQALLQEIEKLIADASE